MFIELEDNYYKASSDDSYYYVIGTSGMAIIDRATLDIVNECFTNYVFTDIWTANEQSLVYVSTSGHGILALDKSNVHSVNLETKLGQRYSYPELNSNVVLCLNGNYTAVVAGTTSGITYIDTGVDRAYKSNSLYPVVSTSVSPSGGIYYAGTFGLAGLVIRPTSNWDTTSLDFIIDEATLPAITDLPIYDIDLVEDNKYITIGVATNSGVQIIRYRRGRMVRTSSAIKLFKGS